MSANVDQRSKGQPNQVPGGPGKDGMKEDDPYMQQQQHQQGTYGAGPMSSPGVSDSFFQNYYNPMTYPFMSQGLGTSEGQWSNGADTPMFGMSYDYTNMYGGFGFPFTNWEYANDYWGSTTQPARKDQRSYQEDAYYPPEMIPADPYGMVNGAGPQDPQLEVGMSTVEQGLRGMSLSASAADTGRKKVDMSPASVVPDMMAGGEPTMVMASPQSASASASMSVQSSSQSVPKKTTSWAAIASQPARPQAQMRPRTIPRAPVNPNKPHNMDIGTWENRGNSAKAPPQQQARQSWAPNAPRRQMQPHPTGGPGSSSTSGPSLNSNNSSNGSGGGGAGSSFSYGNGSNNNNVTNGSSSSSSGPAPSSQSHPVLDRLRQVNLYNPKEFNLNPKSARFFIIKSYSEDDIHRSIKYSIWCSTEHGNKRLDHAFREREGKGPVYLIYSVNGSGHFCGIAQMLSPVDYNRSAGVWAQDKWKGQFEVKWIYVKDVPNNQLRHIRLENNENKPVTNSRDTQEVPPDKGKQVLRIMHSYKHNTSIFDDFVHYEKRQEEDMNLTRDRGSERGGDRSDRGDPRGGDRDRGEHRDRDRGDHRDRDRGDHHMDRRDDGRGDGQGRNKDSRRGGRQN